jgi:hypothetical protein
LPFVFIDVPLAPFFAFLDDVAAFIVVAVFEERAVLKDLDDFAEDLDRAADAFRDVARLPAFIAGVRDGRPRMGGMVVAAVTSSWCLQNQFFVLSNARARERSKFLFD